MLEPVGASGFQDSTPLVDGTQEVEDETSADPRACRQLQSAFKEPDYPGPDGYARERYPLLPPGDDEFEQARNAAYATVSRVVEALRARLWK